jgi:Ran GTPase-activating protein (RanGAP) involved in mRNA processing and transport
MCGLRGEKPKNLEDIGLKEFYLSHNRLGDNFMKSLAKTIKYDEYLRVIDLRYNKITESSLKPEFLAALKSNSSLTNLDLRHNTGFSKKLKQ